MAELVRAALGLLETEGAHALTMRRLAALVGMRAPSIYKHFESKAALEVALVEDALFDMGDALHHSVADPGADGPVESLLAAYRSQATSRPNRYRLTTSSAFPRAGLLAGLEDWAGEPFFIVAGEAHLSQALWAFAHGTMILELDDRFLAGSDLDATWQAGAIAFSLPGDRPVGEPASLHPVGRQP
ncbi:MAG: TetR/AcrR family transcriptional regulator [Acidimicrobiales bacterium]|nr:TetR/AcrR family transcriptional regulator [Acidimicrobiales bacterium]